MGTRATPTQPTGTKALWHRIHLETLKLRTVRLLVWNRARPQIPLDTKCRVNDKVNGIAGSTLFYRFRLVSVLLKI